MTPQDVGRSYDAIAGRWADESRPLNGIAPHERAMRFVKAGRNALDVGCGANGRLRDLLTAGGYAVEGVDISEQMLAHARRRDPALSFHQADIREWPLPRQYDFITAWDSIWHVPLADQPAVLTKLCLGLSPGGVLIFTLGGLPEPGEVRDANMGVPMYHATLGIPNTLTLIGEAHCLCVHLEFDQYPEPHVYVIAQKQQ